LAHFFPELCDLVVLTFDLLTSKYRCESHEQCVRILQCWTFYRTYVSPKHTVMDCALLRLQAQTGPTEFGLRCV